MEPLKYQFPYTADRKTKALQEHLARIPQGVWRPARSGPGGHCLCVLHSPSGRAVLKDAGKAEGRALYKHRS